MDFEGLNLEFLGHAGFLINLGKIIVIDPYNISSKTSKADVILISHRHYDHCSLKDIQKIVKPGTVVVCPPDCQSKLAKIEGIDIQVVESGDVLDFRSFKIEAVSAYNIKTDDHPKSDGWLGFLVKNHKFTVYYAGDTDFIPEMQKLSGYGKHGMEFIALLPVAGGPVMSPEEAADAASVMSPDLVIPMSYGSGVYGSLKDAELFVEYCKERNLKAKILSKF